MSEAESPVRPLQRLVHADKCFRQILRLCKFLESSNLSEREEAFTPVMAGICVTYAQPFWTNEGLGSLPAHFREFPPESQLPDREEYIRIHNGLLTGRDWIHEHFDHSKLALRQGNDPLRGRVGEMTVTLSAGGGITFAEAEPIWTQEELRMIAALCRFQSNRVVAEAKTLVTQLCAGKAYKLGAYVLGERFP